MLNAQCCINEGGTGMVMNLEPFLPPSYKWKPGRYFMKNVFF